MLDRTLRPTALKIEDLERVHLVRGDLTQPETFAAELAGVEIVIHCAALVSFKPTDTDALYQTNVLGNPSVMIGPGDRRVETGIRTWRWLRWLLPGIPMLPTQNSFVDVRDVAQAVVLTLNRGSSGERYIVTGYNVDMPTFARAALQVIGWQRPVFIVPSVVIRLADGILVLLTCLHLNPGMRSLAAVNVDKIYSTEKIRQALGWMPTYSLEQSLKDTLCNSTQIKHMI